MFRLIWLLARLWLLDAKGDGDGEEEQEGMEEGTGSGEGDGEEGGEEEEEGGDGEILDRDGKPVKDPKAKIKALESMLGRLHKRIRERDEVIVELKQKKNGDHTAELRGARLENAFLRAAMSRDEAIGDLETAWDLGQLRGFFDAVKDDGSGMVEALDKLCDRYPWLLGDGPEEDAGEVREPKPAQRKVTRNPAADRQTSRARLAEKYPALRGRRR